MKSKSLFDDVQKLSGLQYLSDLGMFHNQSIALTCAAELDPHEYSIEEWSEFISYIIKRDIKFIDIKQVTDFLDSFQNI